MKQRNENNQIEIEGLLPIKHCEDFLYALSKKCKNIIKIIFSER
jgi:hypothetical protein